METKGIKPSETSKIIKEEIYREMEKTTQLSGLTDYELELEKIIDKIREEKSTLKAIGILRRVIGRYQDVMKVKIKKLSNKAIIPKYSKQGDAGLDLTAISKEETNNYIEYNTGISIEIPEGFVGLLFPRSSISKKSILLTNSVGVLDSQYRGEIKLRFYGFEKEVYSNSKQKQTRYENIYQIGDRVGQLIILPYPQIEFEEVEELSLSERGENGFGSSGK